MYSLVVVYYYQVSENAQILIVEWHSFGATGRGLDTKHVTLGTSGREGMRQDKKGNDTV